MDGKTGAKKWGSKIAQSGPVNVVDFSPVIGSDGTIFLGGEKGELYALKGNTGEQTWQKFVKKHKNIFMVLCGHHAGEAVRTDAGDHGNQVHQVLSDYQHLNNGGESWLRYMVFEPNENKIKVYTYNPALDKFRNNPSSHFDLEYPMKTVE